jgi:uncharacterized FlaG/YvyC family protein
VIEKMSQINPTQKENQQIEQEGEKEKPKVRVDRELSDVSEFLKKLILQETKEEIKREALELLEKVSDIKSYLDWANGKLRFYVKQRSQSGGGAKKWVRQK